MTEKVKVSVILPSLNVAAYIKECLESVRNQTLKDIEIICVDAGSSDGTLKVIQDYRQKDDRIILCSSERKSYGYQINMGIRQARGKYIAIVDTDDKIQPEMYETLFDAAEHSSADFVKSDFYGFEKGNSRKRIYQIVKDGSCYNRIVHPSEDPEIFRQLHPAVWSGIYNRQFLIEHDIWHNETEGASFQDTGFWILTYACAKKAYFLNQPFYQYRLDNAASSVCDPGKVFCICDEWKFIARKLAEYERLKGMEDVISWVFYRKYKRNLERIAEYARSEFLDKFAEDFRCWAEKGYLSGRMFAEEEWTELQSVMHDPREFYRRIEKQQEEFLSKLEKIPELIIYGAGKVGKQLIQRINARENIICLAVSGSHEGEEEFQGIPVKCIDELQSYRKSAYVVVAVMTDEYRNQMAERLHKLRFEHIIMVPYGLFDY